MKNFERFDNPSDALLAWADEVYDLDPREKYDLYDESEDELAEFLWQQVFQRDQLLDFLDWLWEEAKDGEITEEKGAKRAGR